MTRHDGVDETTSSNSQLQPTAISAESLWGATLYASRLQPSELKVGSWSGGSDRLDLKTYYCAGRGTGCGGDNGNVMSLAQMMHYGGDFNSASMADYEQRAGKFLKGPVAPGVLEKVRPNGDMVRYNPATEEFGVVSKTGTVRTYYKPDPSVHGKPTNLDYFNAQ